MADKITGHAFNGRFSDDAEPSPLNGSCNMRHLLDAAKHIERADQHLFVVDGSTPLDPTFPASTVDSISPRRHGQAASSQTPTIPHNNFVRGVQEVEHDVSVVGTPEMHTRRDESHSVPTDKVMEHNLQLEWNDRESFSLAQMNTTQNIHGPLEIEDNLLVPHVLTESQIGEPRCVKCIIFQNTNPKNRS